MLLNELLAFDQTVPLSLYLELSQQPHTRDAQVEDCLFLLGS